MATQMQLPLVNDLKWRFLHFSYCSNIFFFQILFRILIDAGASYGDANAAAAYTDASQYGGSASYGDASQCKFYECDTVLN